MLNKIPGRRSFGGFNPIVEKQYNILLNRNPPVDAASMTKEESVLIKRSKDLVKGPKSKRQKKHR